MTRFLLDLANRLIRREVLSSTPFASVRIKLGATTITIEIKIGGVAATMTATVGRPFVSEVGTNIREINNRLMLGYMELMVEHVAIKDIQGTWDGVGF